MNFGFLVDQDTTRYCFLRLRRLKQAIKDPNVLDALLLALEVTGAKDLAPRKKLAAIERRIEELRATATSMWHGVAVPEILAASIFQAGAFADGTVQGLFTQARREEGLASPVITWLKGSGLTTVQDVPFEEDRVDLVGYRKGMLSGPRVVAVQMRNELEPFERALDGLQALAPFTNATYLACTAAMAAAYLTAHATPRWDALALHKRLHQSGAGLLLVERDAVAQAVLPKERTLDLAKVQAFAAKLTGG